MNYWAAQDWSYEVQKELDGRTGEMYTEARTTEEEPMSQIVAELRKMAEAADTRASKLEAINAASGLDADRILAELFHARGQASAYRQAAYFVEMTEREGSR